MFDGSKGEQIRRRSAVWYVGMDLRMVEGTWWTLLFGYTTAAQGQQNERLQYGVEGKGIHFSYLHREPRRHQLLPTDNLVPLVLCLRDFAWAAHGVGVYMYRLLLDKPVVNAYCIILLFGACEKGYPGQPWYLFSFKMLLHATAPREKAVAQASSLLGSGILQSRCSFLP